MYFIHTHTYIASNCTVLALMRTVRRLKKRTHRVDVSVGGKDGSRNYPGINSPAVDALIEKLISATNREELTTAIHALDRVLLWGHYVVPLYHSNKDRIAYWDFFEYPVEIPLYGIVIESWWINKDKQ